MIERTRYINIDDERLLESARAWAKVFPQFEGLVAKIEARLAAGTPSDSGSESQKQKRRLGRRH